MKTKRDWIKPVPIAILLALVGLLILQICLIVKAYNLKDETFRRQTFNQLYDVTNRLEIMETTDRAMNISVGLDSSLSYGWTYLHMFETDKHHGRDWSLVNPSTLPSHAKLDSNKIVLYLRNSKHIRLVRMKDHMTEDAVLVNREMAPGLHEFTLDTLTNRRKALFHLVVDSAVFPVSLDKISPGRLIIDPGFDRTRRTLINKVIEQYLIPMPKPVSERVNTVVLDSLISELFRKDSPKLVYGIVDTDHDSLILESRKGFEKALLRSGFQAVFYPHDIIPYPYVLSMVFPDRTALFFKDLGIYGVLAGLFLTILGIGFVFNIHTIALQKRFARRLTEFINNMVHEFKTPISTISLAGETMSSPKIISDPTRVNKMIRMIVEESARMRLQVEKILEMTSLENGEMEYRMEDTDLHELIESVAETWKLTMEEKQGAIQLDLKAGPSVLYLDPLHFGNLLSNLIDNAVKYSKEKPDILIATRSIDGSLFLTIRDNGIGISSYDLRHVFEKYYRVPTGNVHDVKGYGMGLSYVKHIVEAHHGHILIESEIGKGTTIEIELPENQRGRK